MGVTDMSGLDSIGVANDLKGGTSLGTLLFIVLIVLVLAVLLGAGGYSVRRYWSPAGSEVVETTETTGGAGAGIAAAMLALLVLIVLFFGFTQWNWFGARQSTTPSSNPTVASPAPAPSLAASPAH
jgi:flagellar basal body-associated protein FliL